MNDKVGKLRAIIPLLAATSPAMAQDVSQQQLAECAAKASAAEKLACYEALTAMPDPVVEAPAEEPRQARDEPSPQTAGEAELSESPADAVTREPARTSASDSQPVVPAAVATQSTAVAPQATTPVPSPSRASVSDEIGSEHLIRNDEETDPPPPVTATVSNVTKSSSGRLYFHFANGQIWRQIEPRHFSYPRNRAFEVSISQGLMNEYRLRVDGKGQMVRVRRVE